MAEKLSRLNEVFTKLKESLDSINEEVQKHCDVDPNFALTDYESKSLTYMRNVFDYMDGLNGALVFVLQHCVFKNEFKKQVDKQSEDLGSLRRSTDSNLRSIENDLEKDFESISSLRRSLGAISHNRTGDGVLNGERNNHNNFKPKPPSFNNELTESPMGFINNMENYLKVVNLDQDELVYTIGSCLGKGCRTWFNIIKDKVTNWESFVEEFQDMYWNDAIKSEKRREVEFGKYDKKISRVQYATNLMSAAKDIMDNFSERDFCVTIRTHFERELRIALRMGRVETLKDLIETLQEFDSGDSKEQNTNPRYTNNYNRSRNFRNNYSNFNNKPNSDNENFGKNNVTFNQNRNNQNNSNNVSHSNFNRNFGNKNNNIQGYQRPIANDKNIASEEKRYNLRSQNKRVVTAVIEHEEQEPPDFDAIETIESDENESESENFI